MRTRINEGDHRSYDKERHEAVSNGEQVGNPRETHQACTTLQAYLSVLDIPQRRCLGGGTRCHRCVSTRDVQRVRTRKLRGGIQHKEKQPSSPG